MITGTKEWAESNFNFQVGCSNDCVYCYAKEMAIRFKRKTADTWKDVEFVDDKPVKKARGIVMLPSSHDICQENIGVALGYIGQLLKLGNKLLIVTKPRLECIAQICDKYYEKKNLIDFRFTIGSSNEEVLKLWETHAPTIDERIGSLKLAYKSGFKTSVSCEPLLDPDFDPLYQAIQPWTTGEIWIGKMNLAKKRVRTNCPSFPMDKVKELTAWQTPDYFKNLAVLYKFDSRIRFKDSCAIEGV